MQPPAIKLIECPRDAWQGLPRQIPTETKARYLRALLAAGFTHLDAASFVSPKAIPQMADSEAVLAQIEVPDEVEVIGIVVNERGAERAIATGKVTTLGFPASISETFLLRNQNQSPTENEAVLETIQAKAQANDLDLVVYISMAFGNPYQDDWSVARIMEAISRLTSKGVNAISLADTVGVATPELIGQVITTVAPQMGVAEIGVHLHSTRSAAAEKILAAYDAGCRRFDSALGGLGGCPMAQDDLVGNIPTEEVVRALATRGVSLPLDLSSVEALNREIGQSFGTNDVN